MLLNAVPQKIKGKTLVCKIDNQALKAVLEREGTSRNLFLNNTGKQIFWIQQWGDFNISLTYAPSEDNKADPYTRQSSGLEACLNQQSFLKIMEQVGFFSIGPNGFCCKH